MARPMVMDVDTGVDDAVAIALASRLDSHELVALTTVAGNVPVEYATKNTLTVAAWLDLDVPVYRGMSQPLARPLFDAREHHGYDGLGGWTPDVPQREIEAQSAPEAMICLAREHQGAITFACVGPLTNLAVAILLEPRIVDWVDRLVIMGGAFFVPGNTTQHAEFNIYADPDAAALVARSGMRAEWVPLDATHETVITRDAWDRLASSEDPGEVLVREVTRRTLTELNRPRFHLHDPLAVAVVEAQEAVQMTSGTVSVDVGAFDLGRTRLTEPVAPEESSQVARHANPDVFNQIITRLLSSSR